MISLSIGLFAHFRQWNEMKKSTSSFSEISLSSEPSEHFGHWKEMYEINMILKGFKIDWPLWATQTMSTLVIEKKLMKSIRS